MEYLVEKKADTGLDRKIKISSSTDAFNLEEVQSIKDAMLEHLIFIGMDNRNNVKKINLLSIGTDCSTVIDTKTIIRNAILSGSSKVILVHNHPSNSLEPSELDEHSTNVLAKVLPLFNITLVDHLIVTEENYLSMYQVNKINKDFVKKEYKMLDQTLLIEENERLKIDIEKLKKENIELRKINIEGRNSLKEKLV